MSDLARTELKGLRASGIEPTWDQVIWINDLCRKVERPGILSPAATGKPLTIKGRTFWPFTIQAAEWYGEVVDQLPEHEALIALLYSLEHGRTPNAFTDPNLYDLQQAKKHIKRYSRTLDITLNEAVEVAGLLLSSEPAEGADDANQSTDDMVAWLVTQTGLDAEYWTCRVCLDHAVNCCRMIDQQNSEKVIPRPEYIQAEKALGRALIKIKRGHDGD